MQGAEGEHLLKCVADGVELLQRRYPCLAIIHTVTGVSLAPLHGKLTVYGMNDTACRTCIQETRLDPHDLEVPDGGVRSSRRVKNGVPV